MEAVSSSAATPPRTPRAAHTLAFAPRVRTGDAVGDGPRPNQGVHAPEVAFVAPSGPPGVSRQ